MVLIQKENFNEVIETIVKAHAAIRYRHKRFAEYDVKKYLKSWLDLGRVEAQLKNNKINLAKHLRPVYIKYGLGWNENFNDEFYKDCPDEIPDTLEILVDLPMISSRFTEEQKEKFTLKF